VEFRFAERNVIVTAELLKTGEAQSSRCNWFSGRKSIHFQYPAVGKQQPD
jgi:hypothetical protein